MGDPVNTIRIFNEKEVDELIVLDISATPNRKSPDWDLISDIASECFMPLGYGGGITSIDDIHRLFYIGIEKAIINTSAINNPGLIEEAARRFGSQSIVVSIDVKRTFGDVTKSIAKAESSKRVSIPSNTPLKWRNLAPANLS